LLNRASILSPIFAPMQNEDLVRRLRKLSRTVYMLQTDLRHGHMNKVLLEEIESQLDHGIATESRCTGLVPLVDNVRENTLTPRPELYTDTARACEKLKDAIGDLVERLG
ncbi:MAG: hypothetical protein WAR83_07055, partial [Flavobacteriales bacterium]